MFFHTGNRREYVLAQTDDRMSEYKVEKEGRGQQTVETITGGTKQIHTDV